MSPQVLKQLWEQRNALVSRINNLPEDDGAYPRMVTDLNALDAKIQKGLDEVEREQRASESFARYEGLMSGSNGAAKLSARDEATVEWAKAAITKKSSEPFIIEPEEQRDFSISQPGLSWEQRDTLKSTATQAMPVSVYNRFMWHLGGIVKFCGSPVRA